MKKKPPHRPRISETKPSDVPRDDAHKHGLIARAVGAVKLRDTLGGALRDAVDEYINQRMPSADGTEFQYDGSDPQGEILGIDEALSHLRCTFPGRNIGKAGNLKRVIVDGGPARKG